jgi:hypothetical protein
VERRLGALAGLVAETARDLADAMAGRLFYEWEPRTGRMRLRRRDKPVRAAHWPPCGARTRKGTPCRIRAVPGKARCRMHGRLSTGPKTAEGKAAIAASNRRRAELRRAGRATSENRSFPV